MQSHFCWRTEAIAQSLALPVMWKYERLGQRVACAYRRKSSRKTTDDVFTYSIEILFRWGDVNCELVICLAAALIVLVYY